ncbi:MAG: hypothetical protein Sylvanvirus5_2 [Sylvanvirus sp.]|uniref:Uncharacterized protein n=1 Tax=Sylvanvirus sp. TaxID=2487774 RepID=A0A3G5AJ63_9VIRU|nr:MAG: hypothetical protein Sylvanvirus5_2 [Sylvanvirus sp.]
MDGFVTRTDVSVRAATVTATPEEGSDDRCMDLRNKVKVKAMMKMKTKRESGPGPDHDHDGAQGDT